MSAVVTGVVAGMSAGAGCFLLLGGSRRRLPGGRPVAGSAVVVVLAAALSAPVVVLVHGTQLVLAILGAAVAAAVVHDQRRRRLRAAAARRADQVLTTCDGLAADLRAGLPPVAALTAAADDWPELAPAAAAAELGSDVPATLRSLAERPGATQLGVLAAAWQVAHRTGAGLAGALATAADQVRDARARQRVVATEMAAALATARLLVALPLGVLLFGSGLGGDPIGFLTGTPPGLVCLAAGLALDYVGLTWLARIGDRVTGHDAR